MAPKRQQESGAEKRKKKKLRDDARASLSDMAEPRIPAKMNRLCCRICSQVLRNPVTTPCGHNFCMQCIQDRLNHDERNNCPCSCPECSHMFPTRPQLIKNTTLAYKVRDKERSDAGVKRKWQHSGASMKALKRPGSCTETGTSGSALCWRHSSSLDVYCCTDEQIICALCASAEHRGHVTGSVRGERRRKEVCKPNRNTKNTDISVVTQQGDFTSCKPVKYGSMCVNDH